MAGESSPITASSVAELDRAAAACDFPLVVWQLPEANIRIINPSAEALLGLPKEQVLGRRVSDFLMPQEDVELSISALASGSLSATLGKRDLVARPGTSLPVYVWTRGVEVTGRARGAVSLVMPETEIGRLGNDPGRPWRALADVVIGVADPSWRILRVSSDVGRVLGFRPKDLVGTLLRDLVHPDDVDGIGLCEGCDPGLPMRGRLRRPDGTWAEVGLLFAMFEADGETHICFAFIAHAPADAGPDRVEQLERLLRQIADELRAAHAMRVVESLPSSRDLPLGELSSRQWEILSRLKRGQRVATIARDLYLSQTTVRNHLSAIYQRFGVHSQRELLDLLSSY